MRLSRIKLPNINSLYGRIFAIFWFTMLLVLIAVLSLPHLDLAKLATFQKSTINVW